MAAYRRPIGDGLLVSMDRNGRNDFAALDIWPDLELDNLPDRGDDD